MVHIPSNVLFISSLLLFASASPFSVSEPNVPAPTTTAVVSPQPLGMGYFLGIKRKRFARELSFELGERDATSRTARRQEPPEASLPPPTTEPEPPTTDLPPGGKGDPSPTGVPTSTNTTDKKVPTGTSLPGLTGTVIPGKPPVADLAEPTNPLETGGNPTAPGGAEPTATGATDPTPTGVTEPSVPTDTPPISCVNAPPGTVDPATGLPCPLSDVSGTNTQEPGAEPTQPPTPAAGEPSSSVPTDTPPISPACVNAPPGTVDPTTGLPCPSSGDSATTQEPGAEPTQLPPASPATTQEPGAEATQPPPASPTQADGEPSSTGIADPSVPTDTPPIPPACVNAPPGTVDPTTGLPCPPSDDSATTQEPGAEPTELPTPAAGEPSSSVPTDTPPISPACANAPPGTVDPTTGLPCPSSDDSATTQEPGAEPTQLSPASPATPQEPGAEATQPPPASPTQAEGEPSSTGIANPSVPTDTPPVSPACVNALPGTVDPTTGLPCLSSDDSANTQEPGAEPTQLPTPPTQAEGEPSSTGIADPSVPTDTPPISPACVNAPPGTVDPKTGLPCPSSDDPANTQEPGAEPSQSPTPADGEPSSTGVAEPPTATETPPISPANPTNTQEPDAEPTPPPSPSSEPANNEAVFSTIVEPLAVAEEAAATDASSAISSTPTGPVPAVVTSGPAAQGLLSPPAASAVSSALSRGVNPGTVITGRKTATGSIPVPTPQLSVTGGNGKPISIDAHWHVDIGKRQGWSGRPSRIFGRKLPE